jgi:hypothetical protein
MRLSRLAATAATAAAAITVLSGCALTHHNATPAQPAIQPHAALHLTATRPAPASPALTWLTSPGGQAQVTLNTDVDTLAAALDIENYSPTTANHLVFEADARALRTQARTILAHPALLPAAHRTQYVTMLNDFITVANLLQPGAGYGTTTQDYTAWYTALRASNITVW